MGLDSAIRGALAAKKVKIRKDDWLYGMTDPGNIDLTKRPPVKVPGGGSATVYSMGIGEDDKEVLIPKVGRGRIMSDDEAVQEYRETGKHLGKFKGIKGAKDYADRLHRAYQNREIPGH